MQAHLHCLAEAEDALQHKLDGPDQTTFRERGRAGCISPGQAPWQCTTTRPAAAPGRCDPSFAAQLPAV